MPPKPKKHRNDWSWVDQVTSAAEITEEHRLAAAGLTDAIPCAFAFPTSESDVLPFKDKRCNAKLCETISTCYNHLGTKHLLDPKGKGRYVNDNLTKKADSREKGIPAGLRNLGATCYANAFLQLWFHNIAFRNAIYACAPIPGSPLFHLAHIFASLENTESKFVDPMPLIEALRLNKGEQQDAAEFSKLFLEMITNELLKQKDPKLRGMTKDLFEGTIQNTTTCDCGFASQRDSSFLELELSLKEGTSLMDRLQYSLTDERLEGDNQYHCQSCGIKRNATRSAAVTSLPPVLHFSLLRFVFDYKTYERKKSRASITFPRKMELGGHYYRLQAIITHSGPSAHQGHFVCEALDQETGKWFMCDDEDVSMINRSESVYEETRHRNPSPGSGTGTEPPLKRAKTDENTLKSKDAYMLVYTRLNHVDPIDPPPDIMHKIHLELAEWYNEQGRQEVDRYVLEEEFEALVGAKKQVARVLPGMECLIPSAELTRWFGGEKLDDLFKPWTIPVCPHGDVDPDSTGLFKMISLEAFELLHEYGYDFPHGYTSDLPLFKKKSKRQVIDLSQSPPPTAEESPGIGQTVTGTGSIENGVGAVASMMEIDHVPMPGSSIIRETNGINGHNTPKDTDNTVGVKEMAGRMETNGGLVESQRLSTTSVNLPKGGYDSRQYQTLSNDPTNSVASSSKLRTGSADMSRTSSSQSGVQTFGLLPRMTICPICVEAEYHSRIAPGISQEDKEFWKSEIKVDRQIIKLMDPKFVIYDIEYYFLPDDFVEPWQEFVKYDYATRPTLAKDMGRCVHGLLDVDLEMDNIHFIEQKGWDQVVQKYGEADPITFRFPKSIPQDASEKRSAKTHISVGTCEPCRRARLSNFEETQVYLKLERTTIPTSRRSKNKEVSYDVKKSTTVVDIKVEIMHQTGITPINLVLYHNGRELLNEETVASIGILTGDQIVGKEMEVIEVIDEPVVAERGFGGTALHGRLACPDCTFENQPEVACCEMCSRPFGFDT